MVKVGPKRNSVLEPNLREGRLLRAHVVGEMRGRFDLQCFDWTGGQTCHWTHAGSSLICIHSMQEGNNCQFSALVNIQSDICAH